MGSGERAPWHAPPLPRDSRRVTRGSLRGCPLAHPRHTQNSGRALDIAARSLDSRLRMDPLFPLSSRVARASALFTALALSACSAPPVPQDASLADVAPGDAADVSDVPDARDVTTDGDVVASFNDYTVARVENAAEFAMLSTRERGFGAQKLVITGFSDPARRSLRFYNSRFFFLHDEWYWFRLLNGQPIPNDDGVAPVTGHSFPTVQSIYNWARTQASLPLDLQLVGGRLYSWRFYDLAFGRNRNRGLATLVHIEARSGPSPAPERWGFELEYGDALTYEELVVFFETIRAGLGESIARELRFIVRSAEQEALAQRMERERLPYWDRIYRYRDLIAPGAREVYSDGLTAGTVRVVRAGDRFDDTTPEDILLFENTPDILPPAAGVITAAPQTPLAHINLLARNRGIPNAHWAGVLEDPEINQLARGWARVVYLAESPSRVVVSAITEAQYGRYRTLSERPARVITSPPVTSLAYVVDLASRPLSERASLVPTLGGKSTGMMALLHDAAIVRPDRPHGISIRAYVEHLAPLRARIEAALREPGFEQDARVRHVLLEGVEAFRARNPQPADTAFADAYLRDHAAGTTAGDLARNGGVRGLVERTPIAPATLEAITAALRAAYADLAVTQGIRFRSSSNVEDIEGFNGAGLYESFTGFLDAAAQPRASDRARTAERAILQVWGSFWGFEAFEERRVERIDHLSASMGVLVHPRFDDNLERATGVCTLTILPPNAADEARLDVNVQAGDQSVANPDPSVLPEVVRVIRPRGGGALRIERVRRSTLSPNANLLDDAALTRMFEDTARVTRQWLTDENSPRPLARQGRTLTIDFEFHDMLAGWPAMRDGTTRPARLVLKQARTLEPGSRVRLPEAETWPVPRDVLVRARRVSVDTCTADLTGGGTVRAVALRVLTDTSLPPDVGFATQPLEASLALSVEGAALADLGWSRDARFTADHTELTVTRVAGATRYEVRAGAPAASGFERFEIAADGRTTVTLGARRFETTLRCASDLRYASPRDYLLSLLPP